MSLEIRALKGLELREEAQQPARLVGYAAVWDTPTEDLGGFVEVVKRGAFVATLADGHDIRALCDHEPARILGRTTASTLRLAEDDQGLRVEIDLPDTTYARDLLASVKRGDIAGMSIGFLVPAGGDALSTQGGLVTRTLTRIDLYEVTCTSIPAQSCTSLEARSKAAAVRGTPNLDQARQVLRRAALHR